MKHNKVPFRIFIVEDDPVYLRLIKFVFEMDPENELHVFSNGQDCLNMLHLSPSIISLDYSLPDFTGEQVLQQIKAFDRNIGVIILSGQKDINVAVKLLQQGAYDYVVKDDETRNRLLTSSQNLKTNLLLQQEVEELKEELVDRNTLEHNIIGNSNSIEQVLRLIKKAAKTNISVSITGETGSGKEIVAKTIHYHSARAKGNFVAVNLSAIPRDLLESELFGYEKGAFTGASSAKPGQFELADKGTLFLDEIAEMELNMQSKILRAIQEREVTRLGGKTPIPFDTRIIIATHRNLADEVTAGNFREDLYYRLLGLPIEVPPLRRRGNDILLLARHFLMEFSKQNKLDNFTLSAEAKEILLSYHYPGNVRELKAIVELATVMAEDKVIKAADIRFNSPRKLEAFFEEGKSLKEYNRQIIHHYLEKHNNDVLLVAEKLDIGKSTIYRMLKSEVE